MSSDSDALSHFTPLDELIQVIYQGSGRFVIISSVDESSWTTHVGLTGEEGRWWQGRWTEKDVREVIGSKVSGFLLDSFVEKLSDTFVKGEISIGNWASEKGAPIQLMFGTNAKTPIQMQLVELSPQDAAAFATKVFIALQAQSRKCRLHASSYDTAAIPAFAASSSANFPSRRSPGSSYARPHSPGQAKGKGKTSDANSVSESRSKRKAEEANDEIQALKAELEKVKRQQNAIMTDPSKLLPVAKTKPSQAAATKTRGVSLANPTKKARKYKPIEFASDDDE
ncbi:hypothetical protein ONZ51_g10625 [Trametes cubensis]|uniref:Uncharacterized protein n=1 Tax=Trametes cubensis TaxID=1111947 RepID=A0AAD7X667_9APHY|nr:hypothetical protein ONZ51_g10625 [Trametes cubensis]